MDSALTPREIQARIRSGEPVADVAEAAGVGEDAIAGFAGPVLAERGHMASMALNSTVRRKAEPSGHRTLAATTEDVLRSRGIDPDQVNWDAWRDHSRRWHVVGVLTHDDTEVQAQFDFDHQRRFSNPTNDAARWIIGDAGASAGAAPQGWGAAADEPTVDLDDDELAIVRVVNPDEAGPTGIDADQELPEPVSGTGPIEAPVIEGEIDDDFEDSVGTADFETNDDGTYEIIPPSTSDLDVLYDMLGGFNEDSVRIYAGLSEPPEGDAPVVPTQQDGDPVSGEDASGEDGSDQDASGGNESRDGAGQQKSPRGRWSGRPPAAAGTETAGSETARAETARADTPRADSPRADTSRADDRDAVPAETAAGDEPEQPHLWDGAEGDEAPPPEPPKPRKQRKRASVPSWDEIMFGSPKHKK